MLPQELQNKNIKSLVASSWSVSWPMTCIMFFVFLIGLTDVYVAGRISKEVQAAYGIVTQLYFVFSIVAFALTVGTVSLISRLFTASRRNEDFHAAINSSIINASAAGLFLSLFALFFSRGIIYGFNVPQALRGLAVPLMKIYSVGLLFSYILLNTNGILRACGMIKKSLWTMAVVCFLNTALNFILAFGTSLGFKGIAVATVMSALIGCCVNIFFLKKTMAGHFRFSLPFTREILRIGWPAGLLQVFWQLAALMLILILSALPLHNVEILAAFTNGLKIESAIFLPAFAFNMAAAIVVGNLLGKDNRRDAFMGGIVTALVGVVIVSGMTVIVMLNARAIAGLLSKNDVVIEECVRYIYVALLSEPAMAWSIILAGGLYGAGDTKSVMVIVGLSVWLVRVPLSYILGVYFGMGAVAVWWSMNFSIFTQAIFISRHYFSKRWLIMTAKSQKKVETAY